MKTILAQIRANNQITLRYVSRPNCLAERNLGDSSAERENLFLAKDHKRVQRAYALIKDASTTYMHDNARTYDVKGDIKDFYQGAGKVGEIYSLDKYKGLCCTIPKTITYKEVTNGKCRTVEKSVFELVAERRATLDVIKKSQHSKKRVRPWGKVQTIKKFTLNAKQKILEAGAVVDMHTTKDSRFMLTLTVPGSGVDVYDAVARYSGYMVNRLTQIIRRWEKMGVPVHWFFVWEHQKRGALHMHWCIAIDDSPGMSAMLCDEIRTKWFELLEELSVKTSIDLFKKKGYLGTWRYSPEIWQGDIQPITKSVAAYFSKYATKTYETSRFNRERRERQETLRKKYPDRAKYARVISYCPSRYWGSGSRVKQLCKRYRVDICFGVASRKEGDFIASIISKWASEISSKLTEVTRSFKKAAPDTGFIYCSGWETKLWFDGSVMPDMLRLFRRLRSNQERKADAIGAVLSLDSM